MASASAAPLLGAGGGGGGIGGAGGLTQTSGQVAAAGDASDVGLLGRLEWVQGWVREAASGDSDETCRRMAEACVNIQVRAGVGGLREC